MTWKDVKIGDTVFIDEYEDGKCPKANPRMSGPYIVVEGNGCGHCLENQIGRFLMHYPDNLLIETKDDMVKFKFELPDVDAQNLISIITKSINDAKFAHAFGENIEGSEYSNAEREWYLKHAEYLEKKILQIIINGQSRGD